MARGKEVIDALLAGGAAAAAGGVSAQMESLMDTGDDGGGVGRVNGKL